MKEIRRKNIEHHHVLRNLKLVSIYGDINHQPMSLVVCSKSLFCYCQL